MQKNPAPEALPSFDAARHLVERAASGLHAAAPETISLLECYGRVLACDLPADRDLPPFPRSARDGWALRHADVAEPPATLRVVGEVRAGSQPQITVSTGEAAEIMTGAAVPDGADAVVMVEHSSVTGGSVEIHRSATAGENIVPTGAEGRRGATLLPKGTRMSPASIAVAASVGGAELLVYPRPHVAILATGDELVEVDAQPGPFQIRNSNSYSLAAQVLHAGAIPHLLPIAADDDPSLRERIQDALRFDLLLLAGGVSAGKYDRVEAVLAALGVEFLFTGVRMQPGKPLVFGSLPQGSFSLQTGPPKYFFGLPGNPVSTLVTFELFVQPVIAALAGARPTPLLSPAACLKKDVKVRPGLTRFLPALLTGTLNHPEVELVPWQGSGDSVAAAHSNCLLVVPPERDILAAGEMVSVILLP
jgi:molybdopterin molybdotransferase